MNDMQGILSADEQAVAMAQDNEALFGAPGAKILAAMGRQFDHVIGKFEPPTVHIANDATLLDKLERAHAYIQTDVFDGYVSWDEVEGDWRAGYAAKDTESDEHFPTLREALDWMLRA